MNLKGFIRLGFLGVVLELSSSLEPGDPRYQKGISRFYCRKLETCHPGGPKLCGYDTMSTQLAVFDDLCTMLRANCRNVGHFMETDMIVCETKKGYHAEFNDSLQFEPIPRLRFYENEDGVQIPLNESISGELENNITSTNFTDETRFKQFKRKPVALV